MTFKILLLSLVAGAVLSLAHDHRMQVHGRALDDPTLKYLTNMCYPNYMKVIGNFESTFDVVTRNLRDSPLPCEQQTYIMQACMANDTTEIDFLAEQLCLCGSNFESAYKGCNECYVAHGYSEGLEEAVSKFSSVWTAECSASPTQPFTEYWYSTAEADYTSQLLSPTITLGNDRFPNNTAVGNYWTGLPSATLGSITGSATARATAHGGGDGYPDDEITSISTSTLTLTSRRANFSYTSAISQSNSTSSTLHSVTSSTISTGSISSAPTTSTPVTPLSQASTTANTSTNGVGLDMGLAWNSGVVLVVVNVVVIAFL